MLTCPVCSKEFYKCPSQVSNCKHGKPCCSRECQYKARSLGLVKREILKPYLIKNKNSKITKICETCSKEFQVWPKDSDRKYCSRNCYVQIGKIVSQETKAKISASSSSRRHTIDTRRKMSEIKKSLSEKSNLWIDGKGAERCSLRLAEMNKFEYKIWREKIFERDNYTCQICNKRGGKLNADHIKPWRYYPELRYDTNNGRCLCVECHRKTPTYGWRLKYNGSIS